MSDQRSSRRAFLQKTSAALAVASRAAAAKAEAAPADKFQPEEVWRERMKAPDDGKKFGCLSQRDDDELEWIAAELKAALELTATSVDA